jgi:hypothetical protein
MDNQDPNPGTTGFVYHPDMRPCNVEIAKLHGQAKRIYKFRPKLDGAPTQVPLCPCCGLQTEGEQIEMMDDLEELYHLGSGYALYFRFIKYCIGLLLIQFLISGIYTLAVDVCVSTTAVCPNSQISNTLSNKGSTPEALQLPVLLDLAVVIVMVCFYQYMRYRNRQTIHDAEERNITPADYTIMVEGLPEDVQDEQIKQWVLGLGQFNIRKIIRTWDINQYIKLVKEKNTLEVKLEKSVNPALNDSIQQQINKLHDDLKALKHGGLKFTKVAFVTFERAQEAEAFRKIFVKSHVSKLFSCCTSKDEHKIQGADLEVTKAPEPSDIIWEDLSVTEDEKRSRRLRTHFFSLLLVAACFGVTLYFNKLEHTMTSGLVPMIASFVIVAVNLILAMLIRSLARYEKVNTYTEFFSAIGTKLCVAQFLNTAITTLVAQIIIAGSVRLVPIFEPIGLVHSMFDVFISNAFITPLMIVLDVGYFMKQSKQKKLQEIEEHKHTIRQVEAHDLFEGSAMDMASKYAVVCKTVLLTSFYAPAIPFASIFSLIGLFLTYWFNKYVLLKRNILPNELGAQLQLEITHYIEWSAFLYALGSLFFYDNLTGGTNILLIVALGISLVNIFLPMEHVNEAIFSVGEEHLETMTYEEAKLEFLTDYDIENPITRKKALKELLAHVNPESATHHSNDDDPFDHLHDHAEKDSDAHDITLGKVHKKNVDIAHIVGERQPKTKSKRRPKIAADGAQGGTIEISVPKFGNPNLGQALIGNETVQLDTNFETTTTTVFETQYEQPHHNKHHHHHRDNNNY